MRYLRTETAGPLFERMKAKLAGIASHTGMAGVFCLLGADIYRVQAVEPVPGRELPPAWNGPALLPALRRSIDALGRAEGLDGLIDVFCSSLERQFGIQHQMLLMADAARQRLFIVASRGYPSSGAGAEIPYGVGVIGVAARERVPIRIMFPPANTPTAGCCASRQRAAVWPNSWKPRFPCRGWPSRRASWQCRYWPAIIWWRWPMWRVSMNATSATTWRTHWWRCAPPSVWRCTCSSARWNGEEDGAGGPPEAVAERPGVALRVRHFSRDDSGFVDDDYLIKGVAGAILWKLLQDHVQDGRCEFSTRELRLAPALRLPEVCDNLDARLILLQRRLLDRSDSLRIEKTGRGRFRLALGRPVLPAYPFGLEKPTLAQNSCIPCTVKNIALSHATQSVGEADITSFT